MRPEPIDAHSGRIAVHICESLQILKNALTPCFRGQREIHNALHAHTTWAPPEASSTWRSTGQLPACSAMRGSRRLVPLLSGPWAPLGEAHADLQRLRVPRRGVHTTGWFKRHGRLQFASEQFGLAERDQGYHFLVFLHLLATNLPGDLCVHSDKTQICCAGTEYERNRSRKWSGAASSRDKQATRAAEGGTLASCSNARTLIRRQVSVNVHRCSSTCMRFRAALNLVGCKRAREFPCPCTLRAFGLCLDPLP